MQWVSEWKEQRQQTKWNEFSQQKEKETLKYSLQSHWKANDGNSIIIRASINIFHFIFTYISSFSSSHTSMPESDIPPPASNGTVGCWELQRDLQNWQKSVRIGNNYGFAQEICWGCQWYIHQRTTINFLSSAAGILSPPNTVSSCCRSERRNIVQSPLTVWSQSPVD